MADKAAVELKAPFKYAKASPKLFVKHNLASKPFDGDSDEDDND